MSKAKDIAEGLLILSKYKGGEYAQAEHDQIYAGPGDARTNASLPDRVMRRREASAVP